MFVEKYNTLKWKIAGYRNPVIGEYILCYDRKWQKIISQVEKEIDKKCFIMKRIGDEK